MAQKHDNSRFEESSPLNALIGFCLRNKPVVALAVVLVIAWGLIVAPFDWKVGELQRYPVSLK